MLSKCTNELNLTEELNYTILKEAMHAKGYSFGTMEGLTLIAEGTIKNILNGKVKKTSAQNLNKICKVLGVPIEKVLGAEEIQKQIENQGIKEGDVSVIALKEIYEKQQVLFNETNERHIDNIRTHYEQHHEDLKENFEKILAGKKELIETYKEYILALKKGLLVCVIMLIVCLTAFIAVLIAEIMNPELMR